MSRENVLSVRKLSTEFHGDRGHVRVLEDVSFEVGRGKIVGLVEVRLRQDRDGLVAHGAGAGAAGKVSAERIDLDGTDLAKLDADGCGASAGRDIAMVFGADDLAQPGAPGLGAGGRAAARHRARMARIRGAC
jgi:peptide/nickel transport system ATP-binding protein/oligopeptide transport system ATP-binding protein